MKTLKFGGTSMANAESITCVKDIVLADKGAKYVIVSAPGKRTSEDIKVTDLLISVSKGENTAEKLERFALVKTRFYNIINDLKVEVSLDDDFSAIESKIDSLSYDYIVSRGEYFSAKVLASLIGYDFIDATQFIKFNGVTFDSELTNKLGGEKLANCTKGFVVPGFYGENENGEIVTFSRGGSDVTGAIVARAVKADMYENWTDVDGFMVCDPRIVDSPRIIDLLTYKELRELSYMGASVLHPEAVFPVRSEDIPINIRNTFKVEAPGTFIVPTKFLKEEKYSRPNRTITGIAGQKDFIGIFIEKQMMNNEVGYIKTLLDILYDNKVSLEHLPTGIDTVTLVIDSKGLSDEVLDNVVANIKSISQPDAIEVIKGISLLAVVGHGMFYSKGTASRVCGALSNANINIKMIDQGSSELNIIVGVDNGDYEKAISALYNEFE